MHKMADKCADKILTRQTAVCRSEP